MNLKFMFLANCETGAQNRLFNNAKLSTVLLSKKTKKDVSQYPRAIFLHLKICIFKDYYQIIHVYFIMFHELIHYAYKCCIANMVHGEERTNAKE
jgi:hypothetical protein